MNKNELNKLITKDTDKKIIDYINKFLRKYFTVQNYSTKDLSKFHLRTKEFSKNELYKNKYIGTFTDNRTIYHVSTDHEFIKYANDINIRVLNTFYYIFEYLKKGIYVSIKNGILDVFLPFSKENYHNCFSHLLKAPKGYTRGSVFNDDRILNMYKFNEYTNDLAAYELEFFLKNVYSKGINNFLTIEKDPSKWYTNNYIFRNTIFNHKAEKEGQFDEGDKTVSIYLELLLDTLTEYDDIPDVCFFMNARDYPYVKKNGTIPYDSIYGTNNTTVLYNPNDFIPILSQSVRDDFVDMLIPTEDDIVSCLDIITNDNKVPYKDIGPTNANDKRKKLIFRGSLTGPSYSIANNQRLQLCYFSALDNNLIDAKLVFNASTARIRKNPDNEYCENLDTKKLIYLNNYEQKHIFDLISVQRLSDTDQAAYKYIIDIDGYVSAFRLGKMFSYGSVIFKVESPWKTWLHNYLKPIKCSDLKRLRKDFRFDFNIITVPLYPNTSFINIGILVEAINFLNDNDSIANIFCSNSRAFYENYINKQNIINYTKDLLQEIAERSTSERSTDDQLHYNCPQEVLETSIYKLYPGQNGLINVLIKKTVTPEMKKDLDILGPIRSTKDTWTYHNYMCPYLNGLLHNSPNF